MSTVIMRVPVDLSFVHFLRAHAAGMSARAGFTIDAIDDIRLAVDEAAALLIEHAGGDSTLTLEISPSEGSLELLLSIDVASDLWPPPGIESVLSWKVLTGLGGEVVFESNDGHPAIRISKTSGV